MFVNSFNQLPSGINIWFIIVTAATVVLIALRVIIVTEALDYTATAQLDCLLVSLTQYR
jgi:hypothetical protein